jgi:hypothetical protein
METGQKRGHLLEWQRVIALPHRLADYRCKAHAWPEISYA